MISFAAPWVLGGLAFAALPLVLHLVARREPPVVVFPAVRYLEETSRRHQRRLHVQHWILLLLRTLLFVFLVLAAAGPSWPGPGPGGHAPTALVLVLDNSLSAAAVRDGRPTLDGLRGAAREVLGRAGPGDRLWLVTADGVPRAGTAAALGAMVDRLPTSPTRLDLGAAISAARALLATADGPGQIVLLSDLQRTALTAAGEGAALVVGVPAAPAPANAGIAGVEAGVQPWLGPGRITVEVEGDTARGEAGLRLLAGAREMRQALVRPTGSVTLGVNPPAPGWHLFEVRLDHDELREDDVAVAAVRLAAPAQAGWDPADQWVATAMEVLAANGRVVRGGDITVGRLGPGASIVTPPADPAGVGALNRALAARGIGWQFGPVVDSPGRVDSSGLLDPVRVQRRHRLLPAGSAGEVLARVGGEPWLVRSGSVLLLGSRLDPAWTELPVSAGYMPFMDALVNREVRGEATVLRAVPGERVLLPPGVTRVVHAAAELAPDAGGAVLVQRPGLHWLLRDADTAGVLLVQADARESRLEAASEGEVLALWPGSRVVAASEVAGLAFAPAARADLRGPLLALVILLALAELWLGGLAGRRSR